VRHELLLGRIDGEGSEEERVEDDRGHEGEEEESGVAPTVVGELRAEDVLPGDNGLRVAVLIACPSSIEKHFDLIGSER